MTTLMEEVKFVKGLDPDDDMFNAATTVYTDIVNVREYSRCTFVLYEGAGATGTHTLTIEASDDVSASNVAAVPFRYRLITTGDTEGAITAATTAGFTTTAGASHEYVLEVETSEMAAEGYGYCRMKLVEVVDSPVVASVQIILSGASYPQAIKNTAIV